LIAYVILMTVVGLPLFVMELGLGQLARSGIVKVWRAAPIFKGAIRIIRTIWTIRTIRPIKADLIHSDLIHVMQVWA